MTSNMYFKVFISNTLISTSITIKAKGRTVCLRVQSTFETEQFPGSDQ